MWGKESHPHTNYVYCFAQNGVKDLCDASEQQAFVYSFSYLYHGLVRAMRDNKNQVESNNLFQRPCMGITRLAKWWQIVITRDIFLYLFLTQVINSFSYSALNISFCIGIRYKKASRKSWIREDALLRVLKLLRRNIHDILVPGILFLEENEYLTLSMY